MRVSQGPMPCYLVIFLSSPLELHKMAIKVAPRNLAARISAVFS